MTQPASNGKWCLISKFVEFYCFVDKKHLISYDIEIDYVNFPFVWLTLILLRSKKANSDSISNPKTASSSLSGLDISKIIPKTLRLSFSMQMVWTKSKLESTWVAKMKSIGRCCMSTSTTTLASRWVDFSVYLPWFILISFHFFIHILSLSSSHIRGWSLTSQWDVFSRLFCCPKKLNKSIGWWRNSQRDTITITNTKLEASLVCLPLQPFTTYFRFPLTFSNWIHFCHNSGNADAAYILAYATIMLATDLHNKSIAKKITMDQVDTPPVLAFSHLTVTLVGNEFAWS